MSNKDAPAWTSDHCRQVAKDLGITLQSVGIDGIRRLHRILCRHVYASDLMAGSYAVETIRKKDIYGSRGVTTAVSLHVSAHYFNRREAITFNSNGYIGFCGWADRINSQPIYSAFLEWCEELKSSEEADR